MTASRSHPSNEGEKINTGASPSIASVGAYTLHVAFVESCVDQKQNPIIVERSVLDNGVAKRYHYYWCPGCDGLHGITINPDKNSLGAGWTFTGTLECPTYSPSQLSKYERGVEKIPHVCHTFIRGGMIEFLNDCTHALKGQTVPLPPVPDWMVRD